VTCGRKWKHELVLEVLQRAAKRRQGVLCAGGREEQRNRGTLEEEERGL
jgi:hypothetical protein